MSVFYKETPMTQTIKLAMPTQLVAVGSTSSTGSHILDCLCKILVLNPLARDTLWRSPHTQVKKILRPIFMANSFPKFRHFEAVSFAQRAIYINFPRLFGGNPDDFTLPRTQHECFHKGEIYVHKPNQLPTKLKLLFLITRVGLLILGVCCSYLACPAPSSAGSTVAIFANSGRSFARPWLTHDCARQ